MKKHKAVWGSLGGILLIMISAIIIAIAVIFIISDIKYTEKCRQQRIESKHADGEDRVYDLDGIHYLFSDIGSNGFIVTAFPVSK